MRLVIWRFKKVKSQRRLKSSGASPRQEMEHTATSKVLQVQCCWLETRGIMVDSEAAVSLVAECWLVLVALLGVNKRRRHTTEQDHHCSDTVQSPCKGAFV